VDERWTLSMSLRCCVMLPTKPTAFSLPLALSFDGQSGISGKWVIGLARRVRFAETGRASTASIARTRRFGCCGSRRSEDTRGVAIILFLSLSLSLSFSAMLARGGHGGGNRRKRKLARARCCSLLSRYEDDDCGWTTRLVIQPAVSGRCVS